MLLVEIAAILTTCFLLYSAVFKSHHPPSLPYLISLDFWLVLGVLATNFVTVLTCQPSAPVVAQAPG
jgi:high-affinity K+ transport system ATPase subunit B